MIRYYQNLKILTFIANIWGVCRYTVGVVGKPLRDSSRQILHTTHLSP